MATVRLLYRDRDYAPRVAKAGDPRGVLAAVNEYEVMQVYGGYYALTGQHPPAWHVARTQLIMRGIAQAQAEEMKPDEPSGTGGGTTKRTISHTYSGRLPGES